MNANKPKIYVILSPANCKILAAFYYKKEALDFIKNLESNVEVKIEEIEIEDIEFEIGSHSLLVSLAPPF